MQRVSLVLVLLATSSFLSAANAATARTASSRTCPRSRSNDALLDLCPAIEPTDDDLNQALFPEVPLLINAESGENDIKQQQQQQQAPLGILDTTEPLVVGSVVDNYIDNAVVTQQDENIITLSEPVTASADLDSPVLLSTSTLLQPETLMTESSTIATGKTHADQQQQQQQKPKTQGPLLSFEEWQRRVLQTEDENRWHMKRKPVGKGRGYGSAGRQVIDSVEGGIADDLGVMFETGESQPAANIYDEKEYIEPSRSSSNSPGKDKSKAAKKQFADVPIKSLKERFNYASIDCAATVRGANKEAKGAQSILYESKDQYMLNKCSAKKYVIINLCEAVLIDTIVMANFEFFSSTFSDFRVWVADRYPTKDWQLLGQWQARNTRDLQVFKVENPIRWFEFIKIEFLSHYGHEYYCPLSLVRVHGMPMMEYYNLVERKGLSGDLDDDDLLEDEYLWPAEVREEIIRPKVDALNESDASPMVPENEEDDDMRVQLPIIPPVSDIKDQDIPDAPLEEADQSFLEAEASTVQKEQQQTQQQGSQQPTHIESKGSSSKEDGLEHSEIGSSVILQDSTAETTATTRLQEPVPADSSPNSSPSVMAQNDDTSISATSDTVTDETTQAVPMTPSTTASSNNIVPPTNNANGAHTNDESGVNKGVSAKPVHANKEGGGGYTQESIYKTIMKRLNALELNATLSQRYLDEQNKMLNDMFMSMEKQHQEQLIVLISRLNDTASNRIDGMKRRYEQLYEELRQQSELNMKEMTAKMTMLAEQIAFERRVSMAQLVVVITLFVFMAISRGNLSILSPIMEAQAQERKRRESIDQASAAGKQQQQQDDIVPNKDLLAPPSMDAISESRRNSGERRRRWSGNSAGLGIETHEEQKQQQTNSSIATTTTAIPKASSSPVLTRRNSSGDAEVPTATFQNDFLATLLPHKTSI